MQNDALEKDLSEETSQNQEEQVAQSQESTEENELRERLIAKAREWEESGQRPIFFTPPHAPRTLQLLESGLGQLAQLKEKITNIQATVQEQLVHINKRLERLKDNPILNVADKNPQAEAGTTKYIQLLDKIIAEVDQEMVLLSQYLGLNTPTMLPVEFFASDDFNEYISSKMVRVRKQIKSIEKDLNVSFSRYQVSFNRHQEELVYLETFILHNLRLKAAQEQAEKKQINTTAPTTE